MVRSPSSPTPGYSLVEIVGEFLDAETDRGLHAYFRRHYGEYFLALARIHRTTFARQAANLWAIKEALWRNLLSQIRFDPALSLVDSFPLPVCRFARVCRCRCLAGESAFSYDEAAKLTFYSLRAHVCVCWPEVICSVSLAPADVHGLRMAEGFTRSSEGVGFGRQELPEPES